MVDFTAAITKGIGLSSMLGSQEQFIKKATEQIEKAKGEVGDKIDIRQGKLTELSSLQSLIKSIKSQAANLTNPLSSSFDNKKTVLSTADVGSVEDYLTGVQVDQNSLVGSVNVAVASVATQSKLILSSAANTGFVKGAQLNKAGNMVLTLTDGITQRTVNIIATDTIEQIRDKTNQQFQANRDQFEAFLVDAGAGAYLEIRAKQTGAGAAGIVVAYNDAAPILGLALVGGDFHSQSNVQGADASIRVDGLTITQASNKFTNVVPGLSFTLAGRANTANGGLPGGFVSSTITTSQDTAAARESIIKFGNALNELSYFIAKNSQSNGSPDKFRFADPSVVHNFDSDDSPLRNSSALREAMQVWQTFTTSRNAAQGEVGSIYELGMNIKAAVKDGVEYQTVYFEDEGKFNKAMNDAPERVRKFFVTDTAIVPQGGAISSLRWLPGEFDRSVSWVVANKDITISATYHAANAGQLVGVSTTIGGIVYNATIKPSAGGYNVKFADNSPLNGMEFKINPQGAVNRTDNFIINVKPGMANIVTDQLRDMFSDSGLAGTTIMQGKFFENEIDKLNTELARVEKELKAATEKTNREYQTIAQLDLMAGIQTAMIQAALASLTSSAA